MYEAMEKICDYFGNKTLDANSQKFDETSVSDFIKLNHDIYLPVNIHNYLVEDNYHSIALLTLFIDLTYNDGQLTKATKISLTEEYILQSLAIIDVNNVFLNNTYYGLSPFSLASTYLGVASRGIHLDYLRDGCSDKVDLQWDKDKYSKGRPLEYSCNSYIIDLRWDKIPWSNFIKHNYHHFTPKMLVILLEYSEPNNSVADIVWDIHERFLDTYGEDSMILTNHINKYDHAISFTAEGEFRIINWIKSNMS